jgi:hypothetical protein
MIAISDRNVLHAITSLKRTLSFALGRGLAVAATLLMLSSLTAVAGESGLWRNSGDWQIRVDSSLGHGCFMVASFRDGEIIRLGFDNNSNVSYLMMGNPKWRSLEKGMYYTVSLQFNGIPTIPWTGVVTDRGLPLLSLYEREILALFRRKDNANCVLSGKRRCATPTHRNVRSGKRGIRMQPCIYSV